MTLDSRTPDRRGLKREGQGFGKSRALVTYISKDNIVLVKYEELRKNTFETIFSIYKFLKIEISENDLNKIISKYSYENIPEDEKGQGKFVRFASPGKWKENFTNEEVDITNKIMGETLKSLGYDKN